MKLKWNTILAGVALLTAIPVLAADNKEKIMEVKAGKRTEARAEWWGFDKKDSTKALQQAIDSGVKKLKVGNMKSPWMIRPIKLRSDQEIIFEKGVVVKAVPGEFTHIHDCLFQARGKKNIVLRGDATLMMNIRDYQNTAIYKFSEWRHAISLLSCENVIIEGLKIKDSGGDGIYIGVLREKGKKTQNYCKDIIIDNVVCNNNHRQGISVISVENLLIRNSKLDNTAGTAPMAGIDFEPNRGDERLVNCVLDNCVMENNKAYGFLIHSKLNSKTLPVSITVKNCLIKGGGRGIVASMPPSFVNPAKGRVEFINCRIENTGDCGIEFRNMSQNGWKVVVDNCTFENTAKKQPGRSSVTITLNPSHTLNTGNVEFKNTVITDSLKRPVLQFNNLAGKPVVENVVGEINFNGKKVDIAEFIKNNKMDVSNISSIASLDIQQMFPYGGYALQKRRKSQPRLVFRRKVRFLIAAEKGKKVEFKLDFRKISRYIKRKEMKVVLGSPSGKIISLKDAVRDKDNSYSFIAPEKGVYVLSCDPAGNKLKFVNCNFPYSVAMPENGALALYRPYGRVYFGIPAGVSEFSCEVAGENSETVKAEVFIGKTRVAWGENISAPKILKIKCKPSRKLRMGSILFTKAVEDARVKLPVPLLPVVACDKNELMTVSQKAAP